MIASLPKLAQNTYKRQPDWVAEVFHQEMGEQLHLLELYFPHYKYIYKGNNGSEREAEHYRHHREGKGSSGMATLKGCKRRD